jgi:hypothetical protein
MWLTRARPCMGQTGSKIKEFTPQSLAGGRGDDYFSAKSRFMKKTLFSCAMIMGMCAISCGDPGGKTPADSLEDSLTTKLPVHLEDLLALNSEAQLKTMYGASRVTWDTIWGAEGMFEMGTFLDKGTKDEVHIFWGDEHRGSGVLSAGVETYYDKRGNADYSNKWSSATGIRLGMTTDELERLNGKPFAFSGFGWDYGGGVMDWNNGKLQDEAVGVTLSEGGDAPQISEPEMEQILGDHDVMSDNPVVKKVKPRVVRITVFAEVHE